MFGIVKNVAKHTVIYGVADMLSRTVGFLMIPLYTHYLTPSDYGTLELLDLTTYIVGLFMAMGIAQAVVRYYYEYEEIEKKRQVISVALITIWVASVAVLAVLVLFSKQVSILVFKSPDYFRMFNIIFITLVIGLSNEIPQSVLRIEQKSVLYVTISVSKLILTLSLNILFIVKYDMGVMGILISGLISAIVAGIVLMIYILRQVKLTYSFDILKEMLKYSLPLMWSWFGMFVLNYGDRFLLQRLTDLANVGIYSLAYKFGILPNVIILSPFLMIWAPKRFDLIKEPDARNIYSVIFTYFMFMEIYVGLGIGVMIKDVISIVADPSYFEAYRYVILIVLAYIVYGAYIYVQFGVHVEKKTKHLAYSTLIGAALNVGLNYFLIERINVWGAALATLISFLFLLVYIYVPSQKLYHVPYEIGRLAKMAFVALGLYVIASFINPGNTVVSLIVKFAIAFSFPLALYLFKFYTDQELAKIFYIKSRVIGILKSKLGIESN